jgi:hypothetical protein
LVIISQPLCGSGATEDIGSTIALRILLRGHATLCQ